MKPAPFELHSAGSLDEAVQILGQVAGEDGRVLAGGQTLVPAMALRLAQPRHLVDINAIAELRRLEVKDGALLIGACVRHAGFHRPVVDNPLGGLLALVVRHIAHLPIRHRGTFCGSIVNADPASEWCLTAATLGASVLTRNARGARDIPIDEFLLGFMTTALEPDELVTAVRIPLLAPAARFGFVEFSRRAGDFAQAMALVVVEREGAAISGVRIGVGGVESVPRRVPEAEAGLLGGDASDARMMRAADAAAAAVEPVEDNAEGVAYKRDLVREAVLRALRQAVAA